MFISSRSWCDSSQEYVTGEALILLTTEHQPTSLSVLIASDPSTVPAEDIRAVLRTVTMEPFGNFMVGTTHIGGHEFSYWGSYGEGNRPIVVPADIHQNAIAVPAYIMTEWHRLVNTGKQEVADKLMRDWALDNVKQLRRGLPRPQGRNNQSWSQASGRWVDHGE